MKTRMSSLSGDSLLQSIGDHFKSIKDHRDSNRIRIVLSDFLMSGFSIFCLKFPSLLQFEEHMREQKMASHLSPLFYLDEVPSDTHMGSVLDEINPESLAPVFKKLFNMVQESKKLESFRFLAKWYLVSVDGSQYFSSRDVHCDSCMSKRTKTDDGEEILYYHHATQGQSVGVQHIPAPFFIISKLNTAVITPLDGPRRGIMIGSGKYSGSKVTDIFPLSHFDN